MTPREILEETKRRVLADPTTYSQDSFCDTPCCIAGHIDIIVSGLKVHMGRKATWRENIAEIERVALKALGEPESIWLFGQPKSYQDESDDEEDEQELDSDYWPLDLSISYDQAEGPKGRARVACAAIDHYIRERGL